ncbi:MAG: hypothetical protein ACREMA_18910 [Longimicrobiales bacterium]
MLDFDHAHLHLYGKTSRPGRKVGHITVRGATPQAIHVQLDSLRATLALDW